MDSEGYFKNSDDKFGRHRFWRHDTSILIDAIENSAWHAFDSLDLSRNGLVMFQPHLKKLALQIAKAIVSAYHNQDGSMMNHDGTSCKKEGSSNRYEEKKKKIHTRRILTKTFSTPKFSLPKKISGVVHKKKHSLVVDQSVAVIDSNNFAEVDIGESVEIYDSTVPNAAEEPLFENDYNQISSVYRVFDHLPVEQFGDSIVQSDLKMDFLRFRNLLVQLLNGMNIGLRESWRTTTSGDEIEVNSRRNLIIFNLLEVGYKIEYDVDRLCWSYYSKNLFTTMFNSKNTRGVNNQKEGFNASSSARGIITTENDRTSDESSVIHVKKIEKREKVKKRKLTPYNVYRLKRKISGYKFRTKDPKHYPGIRKGSRPLRASLMDDGGVYGGLFPNDSTQNKILSNDIKENHYSSLFINDAQEVAQPRQSQFISEKNLFLMFRLFCMLSDLVEIDEAKEKYLVIMPAEEAELLVTKLLSHMEDCTALSSGITPQQFDQLVSEIPTFSFSVVLSVVESKFEASLSASHEAEGVSNQFVEGKVEQDWLNMICLTQAIEDIHHQFLLDIIKKDQLSILNNKSKNDINDTFTILQPHKLTSFRLEKSSRSNIHCQRQNYPDFYSSEGNKSSRNVKLVMINPQDKIHVERQNSSNFHMNNPFIEQLIGVRRNISLKFSLVTFQNESMDRLGSKICDDLLIGVTNNHNGEEGKSFHTIEQFQTESRRSSLEWIHSLSQAIFIQKRSVHCQFEKEEEEQVSTHDPDSLDQNSVLAFSQSLKVQRYQRQMLEKRKWLRKEDESILRHKLSSINEMDKLSNDFSGEERDGKIIFKSDSIYDYAHHGDNVGVVVVVDGDDGIASQRSDETSKQQLENLSSEVIKLRLKEERDERRQLERQSSALAEQRVIDERSVKELEKIQTRLQTLLREEQQAKRDEQLVRELQARILREEWDKREALEKLQLEQHDRIVLEEKKKNDFKQKLDQKMEELRVARKELRRCEEERKTLDLKLRNLQEEGKRVTFQQEWFDAKLKIKKHENFNIKANSSSHPHQTSSFSSRMMIGYRSSVSGVPDSWRRKERILREEGQQQHAPLRMTASASARYNRCSSSSRDASSKSHRPIQNMMKLNSTNRDNSSLEQVLPVRSPFVQPSRETSLSRLRRKNNNDTTCNSEVELSDKTDDKHADDSCSNREGYYK